MKKILELCRSCCFGVVIATVVLAGVYVISREVLSLIFFVTIALGSAAFEFVYLNGESKGERDGTNEHSPVKPK